MASLVAVDWGTSTLRGALLGDSGEVLQERTFPRGVLTLAAGEFRDAFDRSFGDWMQRVALALVCGMVGSREGWKEAPYCACPAGFEEIAAHLEWIEPGRIAIVPGVSRDEDGVPDVMRGEETQVLGALRIAQLDDAVLVLPGTHSKWVRVEDGRIRSFTTFMTGEVYALLARHSILARSLPATHEVFDEPAFLRGVAHAVHAGSLLGSAFSVRTLRLFDRIAQPLAPSYLSGLVIGEELRTRDVEGESVLVVGAPELARRYRLALAAMGARPRTIGSEATWRGLAALAAAARGCIC
ncbi:MAG TPA: 2-dehydro-3-deoxygalactonokinase [Ramlibacter sp.]|uniref:2-dehydro-3-deoxygalactonokinase n=1 Tax=Ramlibacter sp. TaxID=1917967 RepID=UPI002B60F72F|nr:2-dehydro-3-deoxygalactonokinase [Ramlibacter sp.]HVZ46660.1 2-dehydro-3-deoxygalactonokinase [Ramlibacter sp.]